MTQGLSCGRMPPTDSSRGLPSFCSILFRLALHRRRLRILELQPVRRAARPTTRAEALRHNPLGTQLAGVLEDDIALRVLRRGGRLFRKGARAKTSNCEGHHRIALSGERMSPVVRHRYMRRNAWREVLAE